MFSQLTCKLLRQVHKKNPKWIRSNETRWHQEHQRLNLSLLSRQETSRKTKIFLLSPSYRENWNSGERFWTNDKKDKQLERLSAASRLVTNVTIAIIESFVTLEIIIAEN
ncbi:hypothetical protein CDAR_286401 [Caerostris darwini]|uniref:Uncharacterized protein n=1 Tax=Caerostris darwini TaxID=1538125 RepID=A0AAV4W2U0_9ARAC|nr:hypothetical protein CDAR_286401 [Caerostris darwini]